METEVLELDAMSTKKEKTNNNDSLNKELIEREEIENSPFTIITVEGKSFGVMGKYRLTEEGKDKDEVRKELKEITWNRIIQVMMILDQINGDQEKK